MRGLWRCHYLCSDVLQAMSEQRYDYAQRYLTQILKSLHQVALDHGAWTTAHLLLPVEDPFAAEEFGGNMFELQAAHQYQSALGELRKARAPAPGYVSADQEVEAGAEGAPRRQRGPKARAKGKGAAAGAEE